MPTVENILCERIYNRIVIGTVEFNFNQLTQERTRIIEKPNHMRSATQRIRVLDFLGNHILRHIEIQGITNFLCGKAKSRMRFCFEQAFIIVIRIALHCNRNHRCNSASEVRKVFRTGISHASDRIHRRRAVHDGNSFFRAELVRGNSQFLHHVQRRTAFALVHHIAFTNHSTC